jgi:hypothetical protein
MKFQVVEKDDFGTDWHQVRYQAYAMERFDTEEAATDAAKKYLTEVNCNNSLTKEEKRSGAEAFMMLKEGAFMGVLDGDDWYLDYPKNMTGKLPDGTMGILHEKGAFITDPKHFELQGKIEVSVRPVPGT